MKILGIETSCDETAVAMVEMTDKKIRVLSNLANSQVKIHSQYGGVVPEVAARQHSHNLAPLLEQALVETKLKMSDVGLIAVTQGPGLAGALMVGLETAKTLAFVNNLPLMPVSHLLGHLWSWLLPLPGQVRVWHVSFPFLSLIVSGGHTELVFVKNFNDYEILGQTLDDAAGEAFDKVAKVLNLGYPGGPPISKRAQTGKVDRFDLPRPLVDKNNFSFSFSGLKTAVLYSWRNLAKTEQDINDMAASFQAAVVDTLITKIKLAIKTYRVELITISGGVSANQELRQRLKDELKNHKVKVVVPELDYTGDNAAMIALAGYLVWQEYKCKKSADQHLTLAVKPNLKISARGGSDSPASSEQSGAGRLK